MHRRHAQTAKARPPAAAPQPTARAHPGSRLPPACQSWWRRRGAWGCPAPLHAAGRRARVCMRELHACVNARRCYAQRTALPLCRVPLCSPENALAVPRGMMPSGTPAGRRQAQHGRWLHQHGGTKQALLLDRRPASKHACMHSAAAHLSLPARPPRRRRCRRRPTPQSGRRRPPAPAS